MLFLWWVFMIGVFVWVAGVLLLAVLMAWDAAKGDRIGLYEVFMTLIWPIEFAKMLFIVIMVASDDSLG